ncbi:hypothetical protein [Streptomyces sp. NPDC051183]|uniref:hypothetical protein n=1 Tax=unclassified Streptomyces TaxID=2593676 RepID=UPI00342504E5
MKFRLTAKPTEPITVVFEPVAEEFTIAAGDHIIVEWTGGGMGEISLEPDYLTIGSPMGGDMRAWDSEGVEIPIFF